MKKQEISKTVLTVIDCFSVIGMIGSWLGALASFIFSPMFSILIGGIGTVISVIMILATTTIRDYLTHTEQQTLLLEKIANNFADDNISL
ncbi:hypothetical protein [Clostridium butyricum]|nr:hypothetical protein [Clostridium butyricum]MDU3594737.1 hypothetical protein [Clostridium butyricum]